jgi:hypothetical protein
MTRKRGMLIVALAAAGLLCVWRIATNPLRQDQAAIRDWLLLITPIGSSRDSVVAKCHQMGWDLNVHGLQTEAGVIGGYQGMPWWVSIGAYWQFDEADQLSDVRVDKTFDSP